MSGIQKQIALLRDEKVYSDEGQPAWSILEEAADTIERLAAQAGVKEDAATSLVERLIRERDEARAKLEATEAALYQANEQKHWHHEQGYRKGVEDAAKALENGWPAGAAAILALLEQAEPGEKK